ncbi:hypothetical protein [Thiocapsa marina]|nr:hypothetical protein [Thiocapsa marina]
MDAWLLSRVNHTQQGSEPRLRTGVLFVWESSTTQPILMSTPALGRFAKYSHTHRTVLIKWVLPLLVIALTWYAYNKGATGSLFYDDLSNLSALTNLETHEAIKVFLFDGSSGPTGRPLALASFLPHAQGWPASHITARQFNFIIHLFNGVLLGWLGYALLTLADQTSPLRSYFIALSAASIWLFSPLLVSTNLILIQRMTSLSALFGLVGLLTYVLGYRLLANHPRTGVTIQLGALALFTALAILSKESGALFPIYALVIEAGIAKSASIAVPMRRLRLGILYLLLIALAIYLIKELPNDLTAQLGHRGFSVLERLRTQPGILWEYIRLAVVPDLTAYGPFHDDVKAANSMWSPLIATSAFIMLTWLALRMRLRSPWLLFAILWFFAGHLIESTTIPLELYFEHRNYIAIFGFFLAISYYALTVPQKYLKLSASALVIYITSLWTVLFMLANIWGNPLEAGENWVRNHPESSRAAMSLSALYYEELGGESTVSRQVLDRAAEACPSCLDVRVQSLLYACGNEETAEISNRFKKLLLDARTGLGTPATLDSIYPLREFANKDQCAPVTLDQIMRLIQSLLDNPAFNSGSFGIHLHYLAALTSYDLGNQEEARRYLAAAERSGTAFNIIGLRVQMLMDQDKVSEAVGFLESKKNPSHISAQTRGYWNEQIDEMIEKVRNAANAGTE